ncbi:hypothetical protein, partial [uncultured Lamprocystis sp.]|uniref:hypothetical protein n=2 Tax=uncultured Lamprocystis sp. TaxID=543132 RepID=UPI0025D35FCF
RARPRRGGTPLPQGRCATSTTTCRADEPTNLPVQIRRKSPTIGRPAAPHATAARPMAAPAQPDPLRDLYRALSGAGALRLEPDHPWYVPIHADDPAKDPILRLWQRLDLAESESVHLLTGFRGNGKSTELRRLRKLLHEETRARVFLVDMLNSLLMTKPLEPSDFVLSLMTAFALRRWSRRPT